MSYRSPRREPEAQQPTGERPEPKLGVSVLCPRLRVVVAGAEGVAALLEGFGDRVLLGLKDVLVERERLTLGKELGRGQ